jgi:hypothetical protein
LEGEKKRKIHNPNQTDGEKESREITRITEKGEPFLKSFLLENMNSYGKYKQIMCIL